ncbi:MAG: MarR family transcriptional regulator [Holophaga sp.]|nr:MarR family transcriptional regulator [Holophaga sp.]
MKPAGPGSSPLETHLGYRLRRVSNRISGAFALALLGEGVSVAEWVALRFIRDRKRMASSQVAEAAGLTRGAMSKVLEKLEDKTLVTRTVDRRDSRVQWLTLTPKGAALVPRLAAIADQNDEHFFGCLNPDERAVLGSLLKKLTDYHQLRGVPLE